MINTSKILEILDVIEYAIKNYKVLKYNNLQQCVINNSYILRKSPINNHLIISENNFGTPGDSIVRFKKTFPYEVNIINVNRALQYYKTKVSEYVTIFNVQKTSFLCPVSHDEYFNETIQHDIGVEYIVLKRLEEIVKLFNDDFNVIMIEF